MSGPNGLRRRSLRRGQRPTGTTQVETGFAVLHRLLGAVSPRDHARLGFAIDVHPESAGDGRPDFALERAGQRFYIEAVMPSPATGVSGVSISAQAVVEQIQRARSDDFMLSLEFVVGGPDRPRTQWTVDRVEAWLATLRWEDWWQAGLDAAIQYPETQLQVGDWTIGVQPGHGRQNSGEIRTSRRS